MIGHHRGRYLRPLVFVGLGLMAPGCSGPSDDLPREAISGTVTMDSQPLASGNIQFTPEGGSATAGTAVGGGSPVNDGRFAIDRDHGLTPGKYKVAVNASERPAQSAKPAEPGRPVRPKELIPSKYNSQTELSADVKKGGPNDFKFDLLSK